MLNSATPLVVAANYLAHATLTAPIVDTTAQSVDAIVNAANEQLAPGGGICGAIHRAAGPELAAACRKIGHCPTADARLMPGFRLPAKYANHAVGPVGQGGSAGELEQLAAPLVWQSNGLKKIDCGVSPFRVLSRWVSDSAALNSIRAHSIMVDC